MPVPQLQAGNLPQNMMEKMATMSAQKEQLAAFWREQMAEIQQVCRVCREAWSVCGGPRTVLALRRRATEAAVRTLSRPLCTQVGIDPAEFKNHQLPLARIKKVSYRPRCLMSNDAVMRLDPAGAPVVIAAVPCC